MPGAFILIVAILLDRVVGEPRRYHPLAGFGLLALKLERTLNQFNTFIKSRLAGALAVIVLLFPFTVAAYSLSSLHWVFEFLFLTLAIGWQSLREHGLAVKNALIKNDLAHARHNVSMMVSRDTVDLDDEQICKATVESILENGNDAIFAAIFWFIVAGAPGVAAYRLANTLDAMWGYKTPRFLHFGWAAARLDDVLNYVPARLTAFSYFLASRNPQALHCWRLQAKHWKSPNAGPVMAAGAGGLNVALGGDAIYYGVQQHRPVLGQGHTPGVNDIDAALKLIFQSLLIWISVILLSALLF